jgi:hypothetical protein
LRDCAFGKPTLSFLACHFKVRFRVNLYGPDLRLISRPALIAPASARSASAFWRGRAGSLGPDAESATRYRMALRCPALVTGLPNNWRAVVQSTVALAGFPGRLFPFRAARLAVFSCRDPAFIGLAGFDSSSRYITGTLNLAITVPFLNPIYFNDLERDRTCRFLHFWKPATPRIPKFVELRKLPLALRAKMCSTASDQDSTNRGLAGAAGFAGAPVDEVLKLEEPTLPVRIHIVRDR